MRSPWMSSHTRITLKFSAVGFTPMLVMLALIFTIVPSGIVSVSLISVPFTVNCKSEIVRSAPRTRRNSVLLLFSSLSSRILFPESIIATIFLSPAVEAFQFIVISSVSLIWSVQFIIPIVSSAVRYSYLLIIKLADLSTFSSSTVILSPTTHSVQPLKVSSSKGINVINLFLLSYRRR